MSTRRDAREWAVQMLFGLDLNPQEPDKVFAPFWEDKQVDQATREFTESLVLGIRAQLERLDDIIRKVAQHWDVERMEIVDRNVIRMAVYEMLERPDIPPVVSINEAVDIAKYFSSFEAGKFVNGILDRVRKELDRPARTAE